jgi:alkanesulfonate monooxygenase SsuD/methylene tetrahydromethanopterin reductase-like flavin-dependent oxidoreductase (luciferase family)
MLAKMAATLDRIAPGRAAINFVMGWGDQEIQYFSTQRHPNDDARYARAEAFIQTMRATWSSSANDQLNPVVGAEFFPAPLPLVPGANPIPIYAVSRSDRGLNMVARNADYWFADYGSGFDRSFDDIIATAKASIDAMRERTAKLGREVRIGISGLVLPSESEASGWGVIEDKRRDIMARTPHLAMASLSAAGARLIGPPDLIAERAAAFADLGVDLLLCKYIPEPGALEAIADAIEPVVSLTP